MPSIANQFSLELQFQSVYPRRNTTTTNLFSWKGAEIDLTLIVNGGSFV